MKRSFFLCLLLFLSMAGLRAQEVSDSIDIAQYKALYAKLQKAYAQAPDNVANLVDLAIFYADTVSPMGNLSLAMKYICQAEERYVAMVEDKSKYKEVSRLIKKKVTVAYVRQIKQAVIESQRRQLASDVILSDVQLNTIANTFSAYPPILQLIERRRFQTAYAEAKAENSLQAYQQFVDRYPGTTEAEDCEFSMGKVAVSLFATLTSAEQVEEASAPYMRFESVAKAANRRKASLAFAQAELLHTVEGYRAFLSSYPAASEYDQALDRLDGLLEIEYATLHTSRELADFALRNPDSPLSEQAIQQLRERILQNRDIPTLNIYLKEFPLDASFVEIYRQYYEWVSAEGNREPIERFRENHLDFPYALAVEEDLYQASRIDSVDLLRPLVEADFKANASMVYRLTGKEVSYVALLRVMQPLIVAKNWSAALERLDFFDLCFESYCTDRYNELGAMLKAPVDKRKVVQCEVAPSYDILHPQLSADGHHLYYTRRSGNMVTVHCAEKHNPKELWRSTGDLVFDNGENKGMYFYGLFDDEQKMLLGKNGDILVAQREGNHWHILDSLPNPVNTPYYEGDAFMLSDGSGILLCSDRPEGQNFQTSGAYFHGDTALATDIYYVPHTAAGWGEAINLGIHVNSTCCERSPVLSKDLRTLYFITDSRTGLGYGDIFVTTRTDINDWTHWAEPQNYGKEVNTPFDEHSLSLSPDEKRLIISANPRGRYACYSVAATHENKGGFREVKISQSGELGGVVLYDCATQQKVACPEDGRDPLSVTLYDSKWYIASADGTDLFVPSVRFTPSQTTSLLLEGSNLTIPTNLSAILFYDNKSILQPLGRMELQRLADWLKQHGDVRLQISVRVPGADDKHCYNLSRERGETLRGTLASMGVDESAIVISCFGNIDSGRAEVGEVQVIRLLN